MLNNPLHQEMFNKLLQDIEPNNNDLLTTLQEYVQYLPDNEAKPILFFMENNMSQIQVESVITNSATGDAERPPLKQKPYIKSKANTANDSDWKEQVPAAYDHDKILAALFDPVPVESLEKMFPAMGKWRAWADKANANGLKAAAKEQRGTFNPYKAGVWFVSKGVEGWDNARLNRTLANNLPARSHDDAHLLTGD